jgi:hypothetical protein
MIRSAWHRAPAVAALVTAIAAGLGDRAAHAQQPSDATAACIAAVEQAQLARYQGRLRAARDGFATCARSECPGPIRNDCTRWLQDADARLPTAIFLPEWKDGGPTPPLRIVMDGAPIAEGAPDHAVAIDPGPHQFHFALDGGAPIEARYELREGDKNRVFRLVFTRAAGSDSGGLGASGGSGPPGASGAPGSPDGLAPNVMIRPVPAGVYVAGALGFAGLVTFAVLGTWGQSDVDAMSSSCGHRCSPAAVDRAGAKLLAADIAGLAGAGALALATWLYVTRPALRLAAGTSARIGVDPRGIWATVQTRF